MKNVTKYKKGYFLPPKYGMDWAKRDSVEKAPIWCSVDLRDGNQALIIPMSLEQKLEFFTFLVKIGFKEIEIGFPAASETEYNFCRALIEKKLIPDGVAVQVLTQSREHIIKKTFEALRGAKSAIVHLYNSTSAAQREQVFKKSKEEIISIAVEGAKTVKRFSEEYGGNFKFEYSPESFTGTETDFALEICDEVLKIWEPREDNKAIINLPGTVEVSMPHVYASQVEYICDNLYKRENVVVSIHPHNDRGCAVADAEMGLLAGADRVEGTLFGNGERTGNADIVTLALNMYSQGTDPGLELGDIPEITDVYEKMTGMDVHRRHPYCGELVFAAFSGSHQDAIAKGMAWREEQKPRFWNVPYLPIDPADIGRRYEGDVIRINSQSGKGGIGYILKRYGVDLPVKMRESVGYAVKDFSDKAHRELQPEEVYNAFCSAFVNVESKIKVMETHYSQEIGAISAIVTLRVNGKERVITGSGNGRLDAVSDALKKCLNIKFNIEYYSEHTMGVGSNSRAMSYVEIKDGKGRSSWGSGLHTDIIMSSIAALISAINRSELL
ncbi:MAG: 2-isopropylmalate synthase [Oscillospiraceae bacterium]|jgi:2-isopropylmalate synthase|nr:2-isopropylmalate synthase [Oscillospiraceae bacterium]